MDAYRHVLGIPGVARLLGLGFLARIPFATLALLLTLHAVRTLERDFLEAGLVVTATTLGTAISSPWRGRLVDRRGLRRALAPCLVVQTGAIIAMAWAPYAGVLALALLAGLFALPVWSVVRTSLAVLVPARRRRSAFALDAICTEVVFMVGPAAATVAALTVGTRGSIVVVGLLVGAVGLALFLADPPTRSEQVVLPVRMPAALDAAEAALLAQQDVLPERRTAEALTTGEVPVLSARTALLTPGAVAVLVATGLGSLLLTATDLTVVAVLDGQGRPGAIAGVLVLWCAGSLVGGIVYGARSTAVGPLPMLLALGLLSLPVALAPGLLPLAVAITVAGLAVAPMIAAGGEAIARRVPEEVRGEAMGWHGTAMTVGAAAGSPLVGLAIDRLGPAWGLGLSGTVAALVAASALLARAVRRRRRSAAADDGTGRATGAARGVRRPGR